MSFYVSDDLKDRITEKEIIEDRSIKSMIEIENNSKFGLFIEDDSTSIFCAIDKLEKTSDNFFKVSLSTNLACFEQIFFKKLAIKEIVIGSTKKDIVEYELVEAEKSFDNFLIKLLICI